jgi:phosphoribosyl-ATP pyrophosphohydrolase/phosphoribosyl-AMP cyclohydrolase
MIIPSIDIMDGRAVQLRQGRDKVLDGPPPLELASKFGVFGEIAVIDLDAALGRGGNRDLLAALCRRADCRVGGGIRTVEDAREIVSMGAARIIVGTRAFDKDALDRAFLDELAAAVGRGRITIAVDALDGEIVTRGWKHRTGLRLLDKVEEIEAYAGGLLFTCVEKEGCLQGTDMDLIGKLRQRVRGRLTVAGGVTSMDEIRALAGLGVDVQLGMALYTGRITLEQGFVESLDWSKGLIPTVTCDEAGQVLMLAYSSRESLQRTFQTGTMWYFSRSRDRLWMKGETSGNTQALVALRADCDRDTILAAVKPGGPACHLGDYSCFGRRRFSWHELYAVVEDRLKNPVQGSYTASLTDSTVREKILEEAREVVEAAERDHVTWEAADVLYFVTVLMAREGVSIEDVMNELRRRRKP